MQQLGVFAKYWQPGTVKTRLAATIGDHEASRIYRQFIMTLVGRMGHVADRRWLAFSPAISRDKFADIVDNQWELTAQCEGDLGDRMKNFFASTLADECSSTVLIGSDSPNLPLEFIDQAFQYLLRSPVVLGPSEDGGYYLVGLSRPVLGIFEHIDWGTPSVWRQTVDSLRRSDTPFEQLPQWYDVDTDRDLKRLHKDLLDPWDEPLRLLLEEIDRCKPFPRDDSPILRSHDE